jgi:hypothetical protein
MISFLPNFCSSKIAAESTNRKRLMSAKSRQQRYWECAKNEASSEDARSVRFRPGLSWQVKAGQRRHCDERFNEASWELAHA